MDKPTITTIDGKIHEMRHPDGRAYRKLAEFDKNQPAIDDADFIERHAAIIAEFYDDVTVDDVLDMPLEEIFPASVAVRKVGFSFTWLKINELSKNAEAGKVQ